MGMAEIRDAFEAYASGEIAEYELRSALRAEIQTQPGAVPRYAAMAAALRRRNLISAELEAAVVSDMNAVIEHTGQRGMMAPTKASTRASVPAAAAPPAPAPAPAPTPALDVSRPSLPVPPKGQGWDAQDKLAEPSVGVSLGMVLRERFELVEELGRGGMGVVYKALDQREIENKGREPYVAIKVLNEEFKRHPESARALQRESKKSMRLAHPNIVLVRDFDRDRGNVYMVMELLHGTPLDQLVLKNYPKGMPIDKVVEVVNGLGSALSYAHQQGIVHADFKPSNAFLTSQNAVKVLDFGVARVALALDRGESTLFDAGKLNAVSPAYASIELLIGEAPDPRDDIYALGCVTYFLLTGRHPFSGIDAIKARDSALLPMPINGLADHQWRALRAALVFDRWDRTPSVKEFITQFCTEQSRRTKKIANLVPRTEKLSKISSEASKKISTGATKLADVAAKRPWLSMAPAGVLLLIGAVFLMVRHWPKPPTEVTPVVVQQEPAAEVPTPIVDTAGSIRELEQRLASIDSGAPDFIDRTVAASADIKTLMTLAPGDDAVRRLQSALQSAMATQVEALVVHDDIAGARRLVTKVSSLLPPGSTRSYSSDAMQKRQEIAHLMAAPQSTQHWADQMGAAIRSLAVIAPADDPLLRDARETSDTTFELAAEEARTRQRLDQAREYLSMGLSVNDQSAGLQRAELDLLSKEQPTGEAAKLQKPQPAAPQPAAAPDANGDVATKATPVVPAKGVDAIIQVARQQMLDGNTEAALDTIAVGRKKFGGSAQLKDLEVTYDRVEEEVERLNFAATLNLTLHQDWLAEIHTLAGDGFADIEQMLARTLANDIADQRARGNRASVVENLLQGGRKLFPEYAALLEQGKAGTQGSSASSSSPPIVVAEKPAASNTTEQTDSRTD
jgi:serine/threonine protein kinase